MANNSDTTSPTRRQRGSRSKITRACDACKTKKKACTGDLPCAPCLRLKAKCTYNSSYRRGAVVPPLSSRSHQPRTPSSALAISLETLHQTPSSLSRPSIPPSPPMLQESQDSHLTTDVAGQYCGPASTQSFLGRAVQNFTQPRQSSTLPEVEGAAPTSIFSHGDRKIHEVDHSQFHWPDEIVARDLTHRYFGFASPTYRILHPSSVDIWIDELCRHDASSNLVSPVCQATLLMVFATAMMYQPDPDGRFRDADEDEWKRSELWFVMAEQKLSREFGSPTLESIQSRFLMVLYLLCSSRMNRAWFTFGTVVQLIMCLGLHRKQSTLRSSNEDRSTVDCQKRLVWCAYTLDKYLSLMLGRPRMLQDEDIDQEFPASVNDEDLMIESPPQTSKDCVMEAPIFHAIISRILARATKEQYAIHPITDEQQMRAIRSGVEEIVDWQNRLSPILSGAIHPSSLIPIFRRQLTVLQLARLHATMFVTRPLLLRNYAKDLPDCEESYHHYLNTCVMAARSTAQLVLSFVKDGQLFPSFWYTQYIAFNALSAIYIYLIQVKRGRIPTCLSQDSPKWNDETLYQLAENTQQHLAQATLRNAPSWRYGVILESLRGEVNKVFDSDHDSDSQLESRGQTRVNELPTRMPWNEAMLSPIPCPEYGSEQADITLPEINFFDTRADTLFESFATDHDPALSFWPQLDCLPMYSSSGPVP